MTTLELALGLEIAIAIAFIAIAIAYVVSMVGAAWQDKMETTEKDRRKKESETAFRTQPGGDPRLVE